MSKGYCHDRSTQKNDPKPLDPIRIERKDKGTKLEKLRRKHYAQFEDLRRKISKLANDIRERVKGFEMTITW